MTRSSRLSPTEGTALPLPGRAVHRRIALIGCGRRFASSVVPTLWEADAKVVLAADPDPDALRRVAAIAPHVPDLIIAEHLTQQQLREAEADAVIISSPSGLHFEHCMIALACGLPTFVEKPLACTVADARNLSNASQGRLAVSEQRRYREDLAAVRAVIQEGQLGEIAEICYYDSIAPAPNFARSWRNDPRLSGGGILLDLGYHTAGSVQWLLDLPSREFEVTNAQLSGDSLRVENTAQIQCVARDIAISLDIRHTGITPREQVVIRGSRGELRLDRERGKSSAAIISIDIADWEMATHRLSLDERSDSQSLRQFLCDGTQDFELGRHIATLEFLELAYDWSSGRKEASSSALERFR